MATKIKGFVDHRNIESKQSSDRHGIFLLSDAGDGSYPHSAGVLVLTDEPVFTESEWRAKSVSAEVVEALGEFVYIEALRSRQEPFMYMRESDYWIEVRSRLTKILASPATSNPSMPVSEVRNMLEEIMGQRGFESFAVKHPTIKAIATKYNINI